MLSRVRLHHWIECLVLSACAAVGCARECRSQPGSDPAPSAALPLTPRASGLALASPVPNSSNVRGTESELKDEKCEAEALHAIGRGARVLYSDRSQARKEFGGVVASSMLAQAFLALMDAEDGKADPDVDGGTQELADTLLSLRLKFEDLEQACAIAGAGGTEQTATPIDERAIDALFPCEIYARHGEAYSKALGAWHFSSRDNIMMLVTRRCMAEVLGRRFPADRVRAVLDAEEKMRGAVLDPDPPYCGGQYCGTIWYGEMIAAAAPLKQILLAPERTAFEGGSKELANAASTKRFRRVLARYAPVLAEGVCAAAAARGQTWTREQCEDLARRTATAAHGAWQTALAKAAR